MTSFCPDCGEEGPTSSLRDHNLEYGRPPSVLLAVKIPVYHCNKCGFEFTDSEAEAIMDAAVREHLARPSEE